MNNNLKDFDFELFLDVIHSIPSCIFYKDKDLKYRMSTHIWEELNTDDIIGKTDLEIRKDKDNALLAIKADENIIKSKKGCKYIIRTFDDGDEANYLEVIKEPVLDKDGNVRGIVGLINNISKEVVLQKKVEELAKIDMLTGLLNRQAGTNAIQLSLDNCKCGKAFCLLDINKFKSINDTYGHQVGDKVLESIGKAIKDSLYDNDITMRLGGDEFIIFLKNINSRSQIESYFAKLYKNISEITIEELDHNPTFSIGVKIVDSNSTFDSLYSDADKCMYTAKLEGGNHYIIQD